jgi:hypothetical protein
MNALIIYDEFAYAANAKAMFERAAHRADEALLWNINLWRLDMLNQPTSANVALTDAVDAHLILLGLHDPAMLPGWLQEWLEQWAVRRHIPDAALAIWGGGNGDALSTKVAPELSQFAERNGLSFIFGDTGPSEDESAAPVRRLHEVEQRGLALHPACYYESDTHE